MIHAFQDESCRTFVTIRLAKRYGIFVDEALTLLANRKRNLNPALDTFTIASKAVLLSKKGEQKKARRLIWQMYEKVAEKLKKSKDPVKFIFHSCNSAYAEYGPEATNEEIRSKVKPK